VIGTGIEKREDRVAHCIEQGLSVLQGDINKEIDDFADDTFDFVILSQTLQQVYHPSELIRAMLRIGKQAIVSFPNFSHWSVRLQLLLSGYAPITRELPYDWHDTPNIRVITLKDFRRFSRDLGFHILREAAIRSATGDRPGRLLRCWPNFRAKHGIFMIAKKF
jgi:methionine biosynthesis protein MetW